MKPTLAALLIGASALGYGGCSSDEQYKIIYVDAGAGGATGVGGYAAGGMANVGGATGGAAGAGGSVGYPKGVDSIKTHSSPEIMELVDCIIKKNIELQAEDSGPVLVGYRAGIVLMGVAKCLECEEEREEIGIEGIKK